MVLGNNFNCEYLQKNQWRFINRFFHFHTEMAAASLKSFKLLSLNAIGLYRTIYSSEGLQGRKFPHFKQQQLHPVSG